MLLGAPTRKIRQSPSWTAQWTQPVLFVAAGAVLVVAV